jgi:hypothetical protein
MWDSQIAGISVVSFIVKLGCPQINSGDPNVFQKLNIQIKRPLLMEDCFYVVAIYEMSMWVTLLSKTCSDNMTMIKIDMEAVPHKNNNKVKAITLRQVAKLAGVSLTTASRVINDHASVSAQVRERVWRVINENGYQPNQAARSLAARRAQK